MRSLESRIERLEKAKHIGSNIADELQNARLRQEEKLRIEGICFETNSFLEDLEKVRSGHVSEYLKNALIRVIQNCWPDVFEKWREEIHASQVPETLKIEREHVISEWHKWKCDHAIESII